MGANSTRDRLIAEAIEIEEKLRRGLDAFNPSMSDMCPADERAALQARATIFVALSNRTTIRNVGGDIISAIEGIDLEADISTSEIATKLEGLRSALTMMHEGVVRVIKDYHP